MIKTLQTEDILDLLMSKAKMNRLLKDKDFNLLADKIEEDTRLPRISCSTLKRVFGRVKSHSDYEPSYSTKQVFASYLGCDSWDQLSTNIRYVRRSVLHPNLIGSSGFVRDKKTAIIIRFLKPGATIIIDYEPNRRIEAEYKGNFRFRVMNAINSQLKHNDEFYARNFIVGTSFRVEDVVRDGEELGDYIAAATHYITQVRTPRKRSIEELLE